MKPQWLILFLSIFVLEFVSGQETVRVVNYYNDTNQVKEEFEVLKTDQNIKHGIYIEYHLIQGDNFELQKEAFVKKRGYYYYNYPVDLWEYFSMSYTNYNVKFREEFYNQKKL